MRRDETQGRNTIGSTELTEIQAKLGRRVLFSEQLRIMDSNEWTPPRNRINLPEGSRSKKTQLFEDSTKRTVALKSSCFLKCHMCPFRTTHKNALVIHMKTHKGQGSFQCTKCSFSTYRRDILQDHMMIHSRDQQGSLKSDQCPSQTIFPEPLERHILLHSKEKPFTCSWCDCRSSRKDCLLQHRRTHTGEEPYTCETCDYVCSQRPRTLRHIKVHTRERRFFCERCDFRAVQKADLVRHRKTRHGNRKHIRSKGTSLALDLLSRSLDKPSRKRREIKDGIFKCPLCPYRSTKLYRVTGHGRKTHEGSDSMDRLIVSRGSKKSPGTDRVETPSEIRPHPRECYYADVFSSTEEGGPDTGSDSGEFVQPPVLNSKVLLLRLLEKRLYTCDVKLRVLPAVRISGDANLRGWEDQVELFSPNAPNLGVISE
ncbi:unnamed protein product [Allacma fusca]|uniref:C2H2-type domain-containing protein n=1 Tax=Allacma fusca TaxID=39272 RepID=A0A8J2JTG3_9HEXA|nr:unnamed protein product [Allacma fusca]